MNQVSINVRLYQNTYMLEQLIINKKSKSSTKKETFFKNFSVIKFHNPPFHNVCTSEIYFISWI